MQDRQERRGTRTAKAETAKAVTAKAETAKNVILFLWVWVTLFYSVVTVTC